MLKKYDIFHMPATAIQANHHLYSRTFWLVGVTCFGLWALFDLFSQDNQPATSADKIIVDEGLWGSSVLFMNVTLPSRHCSEVSWDQADHMDHVNLGMTDAVVRKVRVFKDSSESVYRPSPDLCLPCPSSLKPDNEVSTEKEQNECCNDCQALRKKFSDANLDAMLAKPYEQCQEGCRVEMWSDVLPVSGSVRHVVGSSSYKNEGTDVTYHIDTDDILDFGANLNHIVHNLEFLSSPPGSRPLLTKDFSGDTSTHPKTWSSDNNVPMLNKMRVVDEEVVAGAVRWVYSVQFVPVSVQSDEGTISSYRYKLDVWPEPALAQDHSGKWSLVTTPGIFVLFKFEPFRLLHREITTSFWSNLGNTFTWFVIVFGGAASFLEFVWIITRRSLKKTS